MDAQQLETERLRWNKYSLSYRKRLLEGARCLEKFVIGCGFPGRIISLGKPDEVDEVLDSFVQKMYSLKHRSALRIAKHAILFVQILRPRLRKALQTSWSSLKSWEEQEPYSFRPPLPLALLAAMVCKSNLMGMQEDTAEQRRMWFTFTALILVSFFWLAETGRIALAYCWTSRCA